MKGFLPLLGLFLFLVQMGAEAQSNQTVNNGNTTTSVTFPAEGCTYTWTNSNPAIGLPASGQGNIASFKAVNTGASPVTATITATPHSPGYAYITDFGSDTVSVLDIQTNTVVGNIVFDAATYPVVVSPDGNSVYIGGEINNPILPFGQVYVVNLPNGVPQRFGANFNNPLAMAISPNDQYLYVCSQNPNEVVVVDATTLAPVTDIPVGAGADGICVSPDGKRVYVSNYETPCVTVIDAATNSVLTTINVPAPVGLVVSPDDSTLYVTSKTGNVVNVINTASNTVIGSIAVGKGPDGIALSSDGSTLYVTNEQDNTVSVIKTSDGTTIATVSVGKNPIGISITPDGTRVYVADELSNSVSVINTTSNQVIATIPVGVDPIAFGNFITAGGCPPVSFTITVNPAVTPVITTTDNLSALTTIYGTPSIAASFSMSAEGLSAPVLVAPPAGFEVSTDNTNFFPTVTIAPAGAAADVPVYIRLAATTQVGTYSGNITLTTAGAATATLAMPQSTVTPALLTVIADDKTKPYDAPNPELTASYIGFVNFDTALQLVTPPVLATVAVTNSPIGVYPITVSGASSPNYNITFLAGTLTIVPAGNALVIPNTFTPNGDGVNDTWQIQYLSLFTNCSVDIFTRWGQKIYSSVGYSIPWDGTYRGAALPVGTYYYIINLKNGSGPLSGFVAIIK
jgi:gliding motility-associated-like protein